MPETGNTDVYCMHARAGKKATNHFGAGSLQFGKVFTGPLTRAMMLATFGFGWEPREHGR